MKFTGDEIMKALDNFNRSISESFDEDFPNNKVIQRTRKLGIPKLDRVVYLGNFLLEINEHISSSNKPYVEFEKYYSKGLIRHFSRKATVRLKSSNSISEYYRLSWMYIHKDIYKFLNQGQCEFCHESHNTLAIHHMEYINDGLESPYKFKNLCLRCHNSLHSEIKVPAYQNNKIVWYSKIKGF